jgi:hypothetical protein
MDELIVQPNESIVLRPGEMLGAGAEPLRIRVGLVEFAANDGGSSQNQILTAVAQCLRSAAPTNWRIETVTHYRQLAELLGEPLVAVLPHKLEWKRTAKGRKYTLHEIDMIVVGSLDTDSTVNLLDQWAELFLDGGGSIEAATCMNADTLDNAEPGYDPDELTKTPSTFFGGLRLTFWEM